MLLAAACRLNGVTTIGRRHHLILTNARPKGSLKTSEQGFIDTDGNFLNREEAAIHAIACGQIKELKYSRKDLFSEELWW